MQRATVPDGQKRKPLNFTAMLDNLKIGSMFATQKWRPATTQKNWGESEKPLSRTIKNKSYEKNNTINVIFFGFI